MKRTLSALALTGLLALGVTAIATPSGALPFSPGAATVDAMDILGTQSQDVIKIDHRRGHFGPGPVVPPWYRGGHRHRHHHGGRPPWFGGPWGDPWGGPPGWYRPRSNFSIELDLNARPRYRAPRYALPAAHVQWCDARYRSYRISDNSFQPYNGPRRQCVSPYY